MPAVQPAAPPPGEELVKIAELPEWAQLAFGGYKTLNRIQSRIFQTALYSNQNMLVCAPTGALLLLAGWPALAAKPAAEGLPAHNNSCRLQPVLTLHVSPNRRPPPTPPPLPAGAGKTNIAMLAVLREIGANMVHGVIQRADFKVVYVAPMKALAAEVTANFGKRLQPLGEQACRAGTCACPCACTCCGEGFEGRRAVVQHCAAFVCARCEPQACLCGS